MILQKQVFKAKIAALPIVVDFLRCHSSWSNDDLIMYTSFFYWQGGEFIEFLQNKYLPTLQLAPRLIQVIVSNSFTEQNSIQCQVLSLGDKLLLSQMCLALNAAK